MKHPLRVFQGRRFLDTIGLLALLLLFSLNAFHFNIYQKIVFYREMFAAFFAGLWLWSIVTRTGWLRGAALRLNRSLFYLLLFPVLLAIWSLIDPGIPLYDDIELERVSENLPGGDTTLYVLRNALLYIPMVLYFYIRGLNVAEIKLIALTVTIIALISLFNFLKNFTELTLMQLGDVSMLGGHGIHYNSYTPYLTYPVLCAVYLLFSKNAITKKAIALTSITLLTVYITFSTSRQSVLFVVAVFLAFILFPSRAELNAKKMITTIVLGAAILFSLRFFLADTVQHPIFSERFSSIESFFAAGEGVRYIIAREGLAKLDLHEWFVGAGLTSVLFSGPHNDYIRWTQRVGLPLALFGFLPFFIAFRKSFNDLLRASSNDDLMLHLFLMLGIGFTLFHSLFTYPREDAQPALVAYLALALWFGMRPNLLLGKFRHGSDDSWKGRDITLRSA